MGRQRQFGALFDVGLAKDALENRLRHIQLLGQQVDLHAYGQCFG